MSGDSPAIKICGLCRPDDVEVLNDVLPDYTGFVFCEQSKRCVTPDEARALREALDARIATVGVFVDAPAEEVAELFDAGTISIAQLHGTEDEAYIQELRDRCSNLVIWKAFEITDDADIACAQQSSADLVLLDAGKGSGMSFDHALLAGISRPFALAGGLDPQNVTETLEQCAVVGAVPAIIDVSSGVEAAAHAADGRTKKDPDKISAFVQAVRDFEKGEHMSKGRFGIHGGQYIPETLMNAVIELEEAYNRYKDDPEFNDELTALLNDYAGRPSLFYFAERMTNDLGGAKVYLKREDMNHTGAHKINNVLGQVLLAKKMGKTRVIAETGAGQHGVATATAAALMDMECEIYMGKEDTVRQALNVYKMRLLGATVHEVESGTATLKDAVSETMREWTSRIEDTHYVLGSAMGPHPFPTIVRDFQSVISREIIEQCRAKEGRLPDCVMACVGGGSNAIGSFYHFIDHPEVELIGCEAAGRGVDTFETAATLATGSLGIFHGMKSYFCQDEYGQIAPVYSISAGLDYPGVGPEHAALRDSGRALYVPITDDEAVEAFEYLSRLEGIIPAIESAHALAYAMKVVPDMSSDKIVVITLSGRGDKDCAAIARYRGEDINE